MRIALKNDPNILNSLPDTGNLHHFPILILNRAWQLKPECVFISHPLSSVDFTLTMGLNSYISS